MFTNNNDGLDNMNLEWLKKSLPVDKVEEIANRHDDCCELFHTNVAQDCMIFLMQTNPETLTSTNLDAVKQFVASAIH